MTRKRKDSTDSGDGRSQRKRARSNPFLKSVPVDLRETGDGETEQDKLLRHTLLFMDHTKKHCSTTDGKEDDHNSISESIEFLVGFLEHSLKKINDATDGRNDSFMVATSTSMILLPWATKKLTGRKTLSSGESVLIWRTLAVVLEILAISAASEAEDETISQKTHSVTQQVLTSKVLLKLVPLAAKTGLLDTAIGALAASCYKMMVENYFAPSFDVAMKSLFFEVIKEIVQMKDKSLRTSSIMKHTLNLLKRLLTKANQKTAFLVLSAEDSLLAFSRAYCYFEESPPHQEAEEENRELISDILSIGLFHSEHHLDGFRSLLKIRGVESIDNESNGERLKAESDEHEKRQTSFQCYQDALLETLKNSLEGDSQSTTTCLVRLVPLLLQTFLEQLKHSDDEQKHPTKKSSTKIAIAQTQFFFLSLITSQLWRVFSQSEGIIQLQTSSLKALSQCLATFQLYDGFVRSDEKEYRARKDFLGALTDSVLEYNKSSSLKSEQVLAVLENLVQIDHGLVHEKLDKVIFACLGDSIYKEDLTEGSQEMQARALIISLIQTYRQLRQFNHFLSALFEVGIALKTSDDDVKLANLASLLSHTSVSQGFARALVESPREEVKEIFLALDSWIIKMSSGDVGSASENSFRVSKSVSFGVIRNVKVEKNTAADTASYCKQLMKNSVYTLCNKETHGGESTDTLSLGLGMSLCGWIIDLQMRCAFWLGHSYVAKQTEGESALPPRVRQILFSESQALLPSPIKKASGEASPALRCSEDTREELLLLASHRLQQLDYLIHEQRLEDSSELALDDHYMKEARALAYFMLRSVDGLRRSQWEQMCHIITSWVPYVEKQHLQAFLTWMFSILADAKTFQSTSTVSVYPGAKKVSLTHFNEEKAAANALIHDASFFEIKEFSDLLAPCAFSLAAKLIREAIQRLSSCDLATKNAGECDWFLCTVNDANWRSSTTEEFISLLRWEGSDSTFSKRSNFPDECVAMLQGVLRLLKIINGLPILHSPSVAAICADSCLRLENYCRQMVGLQKKFLFSLIIALRFSAARELTHAGASHLTYVPSNANAVSKVLSILQNTNEQILNKFSEDSEVNFMGFLSSSETLTNAIVRLHSEKVKNQEVFVGALTDHVRESYSGKQQRTRDDLVLLARQGRAIVDAIKSFAPTTRNDFVGDLLEAFCEWTCARVQENPKQFASLKLHLNLFAGSIFQLSSRLASDVQVAPVHKLFQDLIAMCDEDLVRANESVLYMISCYAMTNPPTKVRLALVEKLLLLDYENAWIDASMASLVKNMEETSLESTLSDVYDHIRDGKFKGLRVLRVLVQVLKKEKQLEVLSSFAEDVLFKAIETFSTLGCPEECIRNVTNSSSLITELIQHKNLVSVKERHVALLLSQTAAALSGLSRERNQDPKEADLARKVFDSCYSIFSTLLQRFPKQLCTCVPSVIALLSIFQRRILYDDIGIIMVRERSQKFTRLCELILPHKEVYKKHVLGLLLEFVYAFEKEDLSFIRKDCLLPSVYYVMDMLSKYEMQQLNVLMDTTARTLFSAVHRNYQKLHAYKGQ